MKARTTLILVLVAAVLAVFALLTQRAEEAGQRIAAGPIFPDADWNAATEIFLRSDADTVHLRKAETRWHVASDDDYPADTLLVRGIFNKLEGFDRRHRVSTNPDMQATFEVADTMGTEVLVRAAGEPLAHFRIGKNGPDFRSQYVRPVGSNEVFQIPEYLRSTFDPGRATWRDRGIFSFDRQQVARLVIDPLEGEPYTIERRAEDDQFQITAPETLAVQRNPVESAVRTLSNLRCDAFPDTVPSLAEAELDPPRARVEIHLDDGARYGLDIGAEVEPARVYVRRDAAETVFLLTAARLRTLVPELNTVREEKPAEESAGSDASSEAAAGAAETSSGEGAATETPSAGASAPPPEGDVPADDQ
ncbi:MAG: DUF4340 domain-containing protein [Candidatus Eisenbacteria bacterium]|nr:DUF4340 domain-containing protein [Candidatus Eisenbacteria bacterium]